MTKKHAVIGSPSSLSRIEKCPGSAAYTKDMPDAPASPHAVEGTTFHDLMEQAFPLYLENNDTALEELVDGCNYPGMADDVWDTCEKVLEYWNKFQDKHVDSKYYLELKVRINEDIFGTSDVVFVGENKKSGKIDVLVLDYKYGMGVPVRAEKNLQGLAYLLGSIKTLKLDPKMVGNALIVIAQMRIEDGWSEYSIKSTEIEEWNDYICKIVQRAKDIYDWVIPLEGNLHAGSHCRFCKANGKCAEQKKKSFDDLQITAAEFPADIETFVKHLTLDEQVEIFKRKSHIEDFLDAVAKNLTEAFKTGVSHDDLKLVKVNGRRAWKEDVEAVGEELKKLGVADPYKKSLVGITEVEKQIGKNKIDNLTRMGEGKVELVRAEDKRPALLIDQVKELPEE